MVDANQQWSLSQALKFAQEAKEFDLYWIEEPTHPDDLVAHRTIAEQIYPVKVTAGEHVPNRVLFKNYFQMGCLGFCQVDALRVGGVSEFLVVSLLAKKFGVPVVPHIGDMGSYISTWCCSTTSRLDTRALFLEYIPHIKNILYSLPRKRRSLRNTTRGRSKLRPRRTFSVGPHGAT